ncbi:hypothetical protein ES703_40994 [subsurface metagenome]
MAKTTSNVGYQAMEVLYNTEGKITPTEIGAKIDVEGFHVGRQLKDKVQQGLVNKTIEDKTSYYQITQNGRQWVEAERQRIASEQEEPPAGAPAAAAPAGAPAAAAPAAKVEGETVPSQTDILREVGERLGVGRKKGEIQLDTITYFVQTTADLNDLSSVWNALTKMNVANDVKRRWIEIYAQSIPGKQIPEELKEKLETGMEGEKVGAETKPGEIPPKPKRFSIVNGQIIGDPEGDFNFNEALKALVQEKGVTAAQADPLATMVEAMKMGPEMATATLTAMIPLITKEPPKPSGEGDLLSKLDSLGLLKKMGEEGRDTQLEVLDKLDSLGLLKKTSGGEGEKPDWLSDPAEFIKTVREIGGEGKGDDAVKSELSELRKTIEDMKDERQKQEMLNLQGQIVQLQKNFLEKMEDLKKPATGKSEMDIISEVATAGVGELKGLRGDVKEVIMNKGLPPAKTTEQREERKGKYQKALQVDQDIEEIGRRLFMGG